MARDRKPVQIDARIHARAKAAVSGEFASLRALTEGALLIALERMDAILAGAEPSRRDDLWRETYQAIAKGDLPPLPEGE